jgi:rubrerythrin
MMDEREPMTPEEILQAALVREEEARALYAELAAQCHIDFVRELLEWLVDEEAKHAHLLQEMITRLHLGKDLV